MKKNVFKTLGLSFLITSSLFTTTVFAAEKKSEPEKIEVTPTSEGVTPQEQATKEGNEYGNTQIYQNAM
jgi:peptidoglycan hydrolase CwlO-like protein